MRFFAIIKKCEVISMAFTVTIDQFEGPLDLMLHLIKDNKLDLFELDMDQIGRAHV